MRREGDRPEEEPEPPGERPGEHKDEWVTRREGPGAKVIVLFIALGLLILFVLQNTEQVRIDFLFWHGRWPAWIVILLVALLGLVVGWAAATVRGRRLRTRDRDARD
jgi:uncharacterized integral membrane protein